MFDIHYIYMAIIMALGSGVAVMLVVSQGKRFFSLLVVPARRISTDETKPHPPKVVASPTKNCVVRYPTAAMSYL